MKVLVVGLGSIGFRHVYNLPQIAHEPSLLTRIFGEHPYRGLYIGTYTEFISPYSGEVIT